MHPVTDSMIGAYVAAHGADIEGEPGEPRYVVGAWLAAAQGVLTHYLGREWVVKHVFGRGRTAGSRFLRSQTAWSLDAQHILDKHRHNHRVIQLANMLLNFDSVDGIAGRIGRILSEDVESAVAELETAQCIHRSAIPFRFVTESGSGGCDYDIEATLGGNAVACEVKCKIEDTTLSYNTVKNALYKARKQLPQDKPGIVFMRIPEIWGTDQAVPTLFMTILTDVFRVTRRISAVIVQWEEWHYTEINAGCQYIGHTEHNSHARYSLAEFGEIVTPYRSDVPWRSIPSILGWPGIGPFWSFTSSSLYS